MPLGVLKNHEIAMGIIRWITVVLPFCAVVGTSPADDSTPASPTGSGNVPSGTGSTNAPSSTGSTNAPSSIGSTNYFNPAGGGMQPLGGDLADIVSKKPLSYGIGPFDFSPMLEVSESYNDNMFFNNGNRKGSMLTQVQLGLQLELSHGLNHYDLQYGFRSWTWSSSHVDDYLDQFVAAKTHIEFTDRNRLDFKADYIDSHNLRGTYFTAPGLPYSQIPQPDTYHEYNGELKYRYGAVGAEGNFELITGVNDLTYDTRPTVTYSYNKTRYYLTPGFYYRIMPKTQLLAQVEATWYRYHDATTATQLDFNLQRYMVGAQWQATIQTSGKLRLGYMTQQFTTGDPVTVGASPSTGVSGFTGDIGMEWSPLSYSRFNISASRNIMPTSGYGTSAIISLVSLGWVHDWSSRLSTHLKVGYNYMDNRNVSPNVTSSNSNQVINQYYNANVGIDYAFKDWLSVGLDYKFNNLSSSYNVQNYDQNRIMLYFTFNPSAAAQTSAPWIFNF